MLKRESLWKDIRAWQRRLMPLREVVIYQEHNTPGIVAGMMSAAAAERPAWRSLFGGVAITVDRNCCTKSKIYRSGSCAVVSVVLLLHNIF
jgi:hypothetical protein